MRKSTRIAILSMPMKKRKVNLTMFANSTAVLLGDVLGMAFVEFGKLGKKNEGLLRCSALQSQFLNGFHGLQVDVPFVHRRDTSSCSRTSCIFFWWPCKTCLQVRVDPIICTYLPSTQLPFAIRDNSLVFWNLSRIDSNWFLFAFRRHCSAWWWS